MGREEEQEAMKYFIYSSQLYYLTDRVGYSLPSFTENKEKAKVFETREDAYKELKVFSSWRDDLKRGVLGVFSEDELTILDIVR